MCRAELRAHHPQGLPSTLPRTRREKQGSTDRKTLNQRPQPGPGDVYEWNKSRPTQVRNPWSRPTPEPAADEKIKMRNYRIFRDCGDRSMN